MTKANVTKKDEPQLPANMLEGLAATQGAGRENATADDYQMPFLKIIEALSPEVNKKKPEYIEDAEIGDICNQATSQIWKEGLRVIPCAFQVQELEWKPDRGGLAGIHRPSENLMMTTKKSDDGKKDLLPNGNELIPTVNWYVLYWSGVDWKMANISMDRTRKKCSKKWLTKQSELTVPYNGRMLTNLASFSHSWLATTKETSNDQNDWNIWDFSEPELLTDTELFNKAQEFSSQVLKGAIEAKPLDPNGAGDGPAPQAITSNGGAKPF